MYDTEATCRCDSDRIDELVAVLEKVLDARVEYSMPEFTAADSMVEMVSELMTSTESANAILLEARRLLDEAE
jgi:hypothetical protein